MMERVELDARIWSGLEYLESVTGPGAIVEMVEAYREDLPGRFDRMKRALAAGDRTLLARLAHDLKSNSASLGALELSALGARLEREAPEAPAEALAQGIARAESLVPAVLAALQERAKQYPS